MNLYNGFMAATYSLLSIFVAIVKVNMVYIFNKDPPYRDTVNNITSYISLMSFCWIVITGST